MKIAGLTTFIAILLFAQSAAAAPFSPEDVQTNLDHVWTMTAAALVFFMQGGFLLLEAGLVRSKNSINVAQKNIADMVLAIVIYGAVGFMFMFGGSFWGIFGFDWELLAFNSVEDWTFTFFVFQVVFCGTAATIMSGAVAERMKFGGYLVITVVVSALIYPLYGHWAWGNLLDGTNTAFLADWGFIDFAGSTVVHSVGGWVALAGCIVLGARIGRFDADGNPQPIHGHSPVLATFGALILWIGWIGFNGGSTTAGTSAFAHIIANTVIAGAMGGVASMLAARVTDGLFKPDQSINGVLGGLVAVTAGCDVLTTQGAVMIGLSGGIVQLLSSRFLVNVMKVDDAVGAVAVHGFAGAWGTIALAVLMPADQLATETRLGQLVVQTGGVLLAFVWAFGVAWITFKLMDMFMDGGLRVSREDELRGLNEAEHGTSLGTGQLLASMLELSRGEADLKTRLEEGTADESTELGFAFNRIIENIDKLVQEVGGNATQLSGAAHELTDVARNLKSRSLETEETSTLMEGLSVDASTAVETIRQTLDTLAEETRAISESSGALTHSVEAASDGAKTVQEAALEIEASALAAREVVERADQRSIDAADSVKRLTEAVAKIGGVLSFISDIAEQTNLLALNATIEAARAGEAGKGFAVVATEVKNLAQQTTGAVGDIDRTIGMIQTEARQSAEVVHDIAEITGSMGETVRTITEQIGRQSAATADITDRMSTARAETEQVADHISAVTSAVSATADAGENAGRAAQATADGMHRLRVSATEGTAYAERTASMATSIETVVEKLAGLVGSMGGRMDAKAASN